MRRSSSVSVHSSSGRGSPSASSESTARAMRAGLAVVDRLEQRVALEARDVGHRLADRVERDLARGQQERQLLDFLLGREQVALHAVGEPLERLDRGALLLAREALGEPLRQFVARDRRASTIVPARLERLEPGRSSAAASRARAAITSDTVSSGSRAQSASMAPCRPRCRACPWACAAPRGASRRRARGWPRRRRSAPSRRRARRRRSRARCSPRGRGRFADAIGGLEGEQRLGAVHGVERRRGPSSGAPASCARGDLHMSRAARRRRRGAGSASAISMLHVLEEQLLLGFLRESAPPRCR